MKRLEQFLVDLRAKLERLEVIWADVSDDEFADFMLTTFENIWLKHTLEKRRRFAAIVARQVIGSLESDDAVIAL